MLHNHIPENRKETVHMPAHPIHHRTPHPHHLLPHERNDLIRVAFDDKDFAVLSAILESEDNALACEETILKAPPEIRVLAFQAMQIIHQLHVIKSAQRKENS